jgi:hypothetical protein
MIIAGSYGTGSTTAAGFFSVVVAPPVTLVAGIGLLRRKTWARYYLLALFGVVLSYNAYEFLRADPEPVHFVSKSGLRTTVLGTDRTIFVPMIAACIGALAILLSRRVRLEFAAAPTSQPSQHAPPRAAASQESRESREWRIGHTGRDRMYYEEFHDGAWRRIDIDGEMLTGRAHHAVYLASPEHWLAYPAWARQRREEIVRRIKTELREPDYEYSAAGSVRAPTAAARVHPAAHTRIAALVAAGALFALAGGGSWLVFDGVNTGKTVLPSKFASQRRTVLRTEEPMLFWFSVGLYASVAVGCIGLVAWGVAQTRRR